MAQFKMAVANVKVNAHRHKVEILYTISVGMSRVVSPLQLRLYFIAAIIIFLVQMFTIHEYLDKKWENIS